MTTYYKINGTYVSWQEAYNSGYTQEPSNSISYKSAASATWGDSAGNGLMQGDLSNPMSGLYFVEGELGWVNIENLSLVQKLYPSTAEDVVMHNTNTGNDSAGVKIESNGDYYYLISGDLSHGWIVEGDLDEFDWEEKGAVTLPTIDFVGKTTVSNSSPSSATSITMVANEIVSVYVNGSMTDYDLSKIYAVSEWRLYNNYKVANVGFGATDNSSGKLSVVNETGSTQSNLFYFSIYSCSSTDATIITVLDSSDVEYYAFKFNLDGVDYYYVLDEIQTDWTSDLSSIGYHLPLPLPTVSIVNDFDAYNWLEPQNGIVVTVNAGDNVQLYTRSSERAIYDLNKSYAILQWQVTQQVTEGRTEFSILNDSGNVSAKNVSGSALSFLQARVAVCSSSDATVEMVLDADNNRYNAFKYTLNGNDYYYVLDGVQTDWTSDLSSIGYHLPAEYIDVFLYLYYDGRSCTFGARDYWGSFIIDNEDKAALENFGISIVTVTSSTSAVTAEAVSYANNDQFTFEILGLYTGVRTGDAVADLSNFNIDRGPSNQEFYYPQNCIWSVNAYGVSVKTWKCRITKKTT